MIKFRKFHFMIDNFLLKEIDKACEKLEVNSRSRLINQVLDEMLPILDEIETLPEENTIDDCSICFIRNVNVYLEPDVFRRLKYLHFRFNTFSIATILRRILRLYLVLCNKIIATAIEVVKELQKGREKISIDFKVHMDHKKNTNKRILTIDSDFKALNLIIFT